MEGAKIQSLDLSLQNKVKWCGNELARNTAPIPRVQVEIFNSIEIFDTMVAHRTDEGINTVSEHLPLVWQSII